MTTPWRRNHGRATTKQVLTQEAGERGRDGRASQRPAGSWHGPAASGLVVDQHMTSSDDSWHGEARLAPKQHPQQFSSSLFVPRFGAVPCVRHRELGFERRVSRLDSTRFLRREETTCDSGSPASSGQHLRPHQNHTPQLNFFTIMRTPTPPTLLSISILLLLTATTTTTALPMPSSLDLLSQPMNNGNNNANAKAPQAPLTGPSSANAKSPPPLAFPVRPNPKGGIDYTRDMLDPILCPMAASGGGDSGKSGREKRRDNKMKAKGRSGGGDAGALCAAWCARVRGEVVVDGVKAGRCDDSGSCICADGTTLLN
ncbi:hypothetical protein IWX49DRAFT_349430 [Phyllosticta citricarpa]